MYSKHHHDVALMLHKERIPNLCIENGIKRLLNKLKCSLKYVSGITLCVVNWI